MQNDTNESNTSASQRRTHIYLVNAVTLQRRGAHLPQYAHSVSLINKKKGKKTTTIVKLRGKNAFG